ncbi:hypothetical protein KAW48_07175 [candidate division WOR-3 bacterium]|nr:hypothetical protein [candidate division WOR-3 bacterium]
MIIIIFLFSSFGQWEVSYENIVYGLYAVDFVDTLNGWSVGDSGIVLRTRNGGDSWDTLWTPGKIKLQNLSFIDTSTGWICGNTGYIAKTQDGGEIWDVESTGFVNDLYSIEFLDSLYGWAGGENDTTLLKTINGGTTWEKVYFNQGGGGLQVMSISIVSRENVWVLLELGCFLYCTYNGGSNWLLKHSGYYCGKRVFTLDSLHLWFTADSIDGSNYVYRSSNGGDTFTRTTGPVGWGLCFVDTLYGWTGGWYDYYLTLDGGDSFEHYNSPGLGYTCDIDFVDRNHGWAAAYYPLTMERNRGEVHRWVPDAGIPEEENSESRDVLFYSRRVFLGKGRFTLYDSSGRFLKIVNGYWDGRDNKGRPVSPGIYFGRKNKETIKIIKLRR